MPTVEAFYLGTTYDLDPLEGDYFTEYASDLNGMTFGSVGAPLYDSIDMLTVNDDDGDGTTSSNDLGQMADDLTYGGTTSALDSEIAYNVTITYTDGTTATTTMLVFQDVSGRVFLAPHTEGHVSNDVLNDHPIVSIQLDSVAGDGFSGVFSDIEQDAFITCFVSGTLIATKRGLVDIAQLSVGDKVCTMDHGYQPIRWIGARRVRAVAKFAPIQIDAGALGQGLPTRALLVSPQHRILVRSKIAKRIFGMAEVLLAAKKMLGIPGISVVTDLTHATYWHFLFDHHEIVFSEGAATESFYTGPEAMNGLNQEVVDEIVGLFPELAQRQIAPIPARPIVQGKKQKQLIERHKKNSRLIYQDSAD